VALGGAVLDQNLISDVQDLAGEEAPVPLELPTAGPYVVRREGKGMISLLLFLSTAFQVREPERTPPQLRDAADVLVDAIADADDALALRLGRVVSLIPPADAPLARSTPAYHVDDDAAPGGDGSAGHPYQTLNQALDAADGLPAAVVTILLHPGCYHESVQIRIPTFVFGLPEPKPVVVGTFRNEAGDLLYLKDVIVEAAPYPGAVATIGQVTFVVDSQIRKTGGYGVVQRGGTLRIFKSSIQDTRRLPGPHDCDESERALALAPLPLLPPLLILDPLGGTGVYVDSSAEARLIDVSISESKCAGMIVRSKAVAKLDDVHIESSGSGGLVASGKDTLVTAEDLFVTNTGHDNLPGGNKPFFAGAVHAKGRAALLGSNMQVLFSEVAGLHSSEGAIAHVDDVTVMFVSEGMLYVGQAPEGLRVFSELPRPALDSIGADSIGELYDSGNFVTFEKVGSGILANGATLDLNTTSGASFVAFCDQAGLLYNNSAGTILNVTTAACRFGLVLQGNPKPAWEDPSNLFLGTEQDVITDGDLPVPPPPPLPEE
jgi:hypothetical protein